MQIDLYSTFKEISGEEAAGKNIVVIDVLRATSVIVTALANGADAVIPVETIDQGKTVAASHPRGSTLLAGERKGLPIPGFDLGNSPPLYTAERIKGRSIVLTTMHGTQALMVCREAGQTVIGSFLNAAAVVDHILESGESWVLLCSGMHGRFTVDDALCAGLLISRINTRSRSEQGAQVATNDLGAVMQKLYESEGDGLQEYLKRSCYGYRYLHSLGFQEDLEHCLDVDRYSILPRFAAGRVTA